MFNKLKTEIKSRNMSYLDFGLAIGMDVGNVHKYLNGKRIPSVQMLVRFLTALDYSTDEIENMLFGEWFEV